MYCRHGVLAHLGRRGLRESTKLKLLVGWEGKRAVPEKKKVKEIVSTDVKGIVSTEVKE